jgi:hypothetical protein
MTILVKTMCKTEQTAYFEAVFLAFRVLQS